MSHRYGRRFVAAIPAMAIPATALLAMSLLAILLLVPGGPAYAAGDEFRAAGGGALACVTGSAEAQDPPYLACLRIGPVRIGQTMRDVAMRFGKAGKEIRQGDIVLRVWPVRLDVPAGTSLPYWVIGFEGQRVVSIQLTGKRRVEQFTFSSLRLGDSEARVLEILGPPAEMRDVPEAGAVMWNWRPFPVTLELKDGRVFSMRVSEAVGK